MEIETPRLRLRPWRETDAPVLYKYASDPEVGPNAGWPPHKDEAESLAIIRTVFSGDSMWAIELKETGEAVGCVGYLLPGASNIPLTAGEAEVGYWVARPLWNRGICTEALSAMVNYCYDEKKFFSLWGDHFVDNPASGRVMEKCGFQDCHRKTYCPNLQQGSDRPVRVLRLVWPERGLEVLEKMGAAEVKNLVDVVPTTLLGEKVFSDDERTARNAAWILTHKPPVEIRTLPQDRLVDLILATESSSLRRLVLNLVCQQGVAEADVRTDFLDFCLEHAVSLDEPVGVQSLCLKLAYEMCSYYPELMHELEETLSNVPAECYKAGMRHLLNKTIGAIKSGKA